MPYISTFNRNQMMVCSWDSFVSTESIARLIDAFVDSLDSTKYGVREAAKEAGRAMPRKGCTNCTYMEAAKESALHANWLKAAKSILK